MVLTNTRQLAKSDRESVLSEGAQHLGLREVALPELTNTGHKVMVLDGRLVSGWKPPAAELGSVGAFTVGFEQISKPGSVDRRGSLERRYGRAYDTPRQFGRDGDGDKRQDGVEWVFFCVEARRHRASLPGVEVVVQAHVLDYIVDRLGLVDVQAMESILVGLPFVHHAAAMPIAVQVQFGLFGVLVW